MRPGVCFWVNDLKRARSLIDEGVAEPVVGPSAFKESAEKKSSSAAPVIPSTDSPKSAEPGPEPSSAAPADPALPKIKRKRSKLVSYFAPDE